MEIHRFHWDFIPWNVGEKRWLSREEIFYLEMIWSAGGTEESKRCLTLHKWRREISAEFAIWWHSEAIETCWYNRKYLSKMEATIPVSRYLCTGYIFNIYASLPYQWKIILICLVLTWKIILIIINWQQNKIIRLLIFRFYWFKLIFEQTFVFGTAGYSMITCTDHFSNLVHM